MGGPPALDSSCDAAGAVFTNYAASGNFKLACCFEIDGSLNELRQEATVTS